MAATPVSVHETHRDQKMPLGARLQKLHRVIGAAHRDAEGMVFSKALLEGSASPQQIAALIRSLLPIYTAMEALIEQLPDPLKTSGIPWHALSRHRALKEDIAALAALEASPASLDELANELIACLTNLAETAPERFLAHVYVRYGGDLSGGQQLAQQANSILSKAGLPELQFWSFPRPIAELKQQLHDGIELLPLMHNEETNLLEEAPAGFRLNQRLLKALAEIKAA